MPSKKIVPAAATEAAAATSEHPEYATQMPPEPSSSEGLPTLAQAPDREAQIRDAAYAAYERRGGTDGDAVQDWLDAEVQWERDQSR